MIVEKSIVSVKNLKKTFENVIAVDGLSFEVRPGEVFGLLGPNGAGKTTTIKLLLGLLEPDNGKIDIFGLNPEKDDVEIKRRIGYVAEEPLIFKSLTPAELFNFICSIRDLNEEEVAERAKEYLKSLGAEKHYEQIIATLSHGNKQKIQIISALLHEPDLLILDEPFSGMDAKAIKVIKEIVDLQKKNGGAVLFSSHILELAEDICDRIAIINKGKLVGIGTMEELRAQANKIGASLEDVFLGLTEEDDSVNSIIKKLKLMFNKKGDRN
ncbi:MAG: ATP-binding cassette domain-containing protein [Candidatus Lokiarchaeota archaeon]|nr:ATP-binding cassette domain-containing protein [Candidatus Lokiarchaeota archaeon]MBD3341150.1 ATP-binding cassette domain-containing protein [Candidatus Lokiarchaeota archaeon]